MKKLNATPELKAEVALIFSNYREAQKCIRNAVTSRDMNRAEYWSAACNSQLMEIGDAIAVELVAGVTDLGHLVSKWSAHQYRPTLRGDLGSKYTLLADIYDHCAMVRGIEVKAYRGGF